MSSLGSRLDRLEQDARPEYPRIIAFLSEDDYRAWLAECEPDEVMPDLKVYVGIDLDRACPTHPA